MSNSIYNNTRNIEIIIFSNKSFDENQILDYIKYTYKYRIYFLIYFGYQWYNKDINRLIKLLSLNKIK